MPAPVPAVAAEHERPPLFQRLRRRLAETHFGVVVGVFGGLCLILVPLARLIPLQLCDPRQVVTAYGVYDNRALVLGYWGLLAALFLAPFGAALLRIRSGAGRGAEEPTPSAPVEPTVPGQPSRALRVLRTWPGRLALVVLVGGLLVGPGVAYRAINGHELPHLGYLAEIEHGKLLNVDTRTVYGPLLGYSLYGFMKMTTFDLAGFRLYWNLVTALTVILLLLMSLRHWRSAWPLALAAGYLLLHTSARYYLSDGRGINGGFWGWGNALRHGWVPLMVLGLMGPLRRGSGRRAPFLLGMAWALGSLYAPESAVPGLVAGAVVLCSGRGDSPRRLWGGLLFAGLGALVSAGLLLSPVLWRGQLSEFITASTTIPALCLRGLCNHPYFPPLGSDRGGLPALFPYYLLPAAIVGLGLLAWHETLSGRDRTGLLLPLSLASALAWPSVLISADLEHLLNVTATPTLAGFLFLDSRLPAWRARRRWLGWLIPALALVPLLLLRPGLADLATGVIGRLRHPMPAPPAGMTRLDTPRGGIWVPSDSCWFDRDNWGCDQDMRAISMIQRLTGGRPTHIMGMRASLTYFLAGATAQSPYTDPGSQCLTISEHTRMWRILRESPPEFVFTEAREAAGAPQERDGFRSLGIRHGYRVSQRLDLVPVQLDP